jgi:hypothetical protein
MNAAIAWQEFGKLAPPGDNEFSSGWVDGEVSRLPGELRSALVRVDLNGGGFGTNLITAELYGIRRTAAPSAATVTYGWREGGEDREQSFRVPAGAEQTTSRVATGQKIEDRFVRILVP